MRVVVENVTVTAYIRLFSGVDYSPEQLIQDEQAGKGIKRLNELTLSEIAKKSGYERCTWSAYEENREISAVFVKGNG